jgi:Tfp pilus assembly protein PilF
MGKANGLFATALILLIAAAEGLAADGPAAKAQAHDGQAAKAQAADGPAAKAQAADGPGAPSDALPPSLPSAYRAPYTPTLDGETLQEVPPAADPNVVEMRSLRSQLDAAPQNLDAAIRLANSYIDYSRQIGDAHYAGYAEAVIGPWLAGKAPSAGILLTEATILQYRHQFDAARELLQATLKLDARNAQGWLTLATLDMVQGRYETARKDCAQVMNTAGLALGGACLGNVLSYTGQARQSLALLQQSALAGGRASAAYRAWIDGLIAEAAERLGDWSLAEAHYRSALQLLPHDNFLLVAYADFLLDRGRPGEVLPLLADHVQSDTAFLRLALAQAALHTTAAPRYAWLMAARFEALRQRGSDYFGREEARFALQLQHDPQTSLEMAKRNWALQRAPWDARVLLEAAVAAHQPRAADDAVAFIEQTRLEDPVVMSLVHQVGRPSGDTAGESR